MATAGDLVTLVTARLGNRTNLNATVLSELIAAQRILEKSPPYPWWLTTMWTTAITTATQAVPTGFIEFIEDSLFLLGPTAGTLYSPPRIISGGHLYHALVETTSTGAPANYTLVGDVIYWNKTPDVSYNIKGMMYTKDTVIATTSTSNLWTNAGDDLLMAYAGFEVASSLRDPGAMERFARAKQDARRRMSVENTSRLESMRQAVIAAGEDARL